MSQLDVKYLADYAQFGFLIDHVHLEFDLHPTKTRVRTRIEFRPNPAASTETFTLDGCELTLIKASIDGAEVTPHINDGRLSCQVPDEPFTWECEVEIDPSGNTMLEGLYMSNGIYCTQCEAEGFRRITFYPDRPDVMAPFSVRINAQSPVLLSNGNPGDAGDGWAEWHDPHPKPSYLFALVAGDLKAWPDKFTTASGRAVDLNIWVRPNDIDRCDFAMQSLKLAMTWDEQTYGREYDLDLFNVVAVDDFNGGAMENKGLNIFNTALVLASPQTTTDTSYERIEGVIAHEYFHNWTGNRITCRDWFQLCLKEGLTVFRDQQFTSDARSEPVKRIVDVLTLRALQFPEDAGPLSHPVRPEKFVEIDNFYTATVYEKGAEVIRALKILVGDDAYAHAVALYFDRYDGQACTIEDWLKVFEDTTGRDLAQFKRWYSQAGTPQVTVREEQKGSTYTLHMKQHTAPTPGDAHKESQVIPILTGLLDKSGAEIMPTRLLVLDQAEQSFTFDLPSADQRPVPSILRGFSAPIQLDNSALPDDRPVLLAHDRDPFNRWEAGRSLARSALCDMATNDAPASQSYLDGISTVIGDQDLDPAYLALMLELPGEADLVQALSDKQISADPLRLRCAIEQMRKAMASTLQEALAQRYADNRTSGAFDPSAGPAGKRALANACLALLSEIDGGARAEAQFANADNMTDSRAALMALCRTGRGRSEAKTFEQRWLSDRLALNIWFQTMMQTARPDNSHAVAQSLLSHSAAKNPNPNRLRAILGPLISTPSLLHAPGGQNYGLVVDQILAADARNPKLAARLTAGLQTWRLFDTDRQALMRQELERMRDAPGLSSDSLEMVTRLLI